MNLEGGTLSGSIIAFDAQLRGQLLLGRLRLTDLILVRTTAERMPETDLAKGTYAIDAHDLTAEGRMLFEQARCESGGLSLRRASAYESIVISDSFIDAAASVAIDCRRLAAFGGLELSRSTQVRGRVIGNGPRFLRLGRLRSAGGPIPDGYVVNDNLARIFAGPTLVVVATFLAVALVLRYVFLHPNVIAVISVAIAALGVLLVASANRGYLVPDTRRLRLRQQHVANDIAQQVGRSVVTQLIGPPLQAYRGTIFVAIRDLAESSLLSEEMGAIAYPSATLEVGVAIGDCNPWDEIQRSIDVPGEDSTIVEFTVSVTILGSPLNPRQVVLLAPPTGNSESAFFRGSAPHAVGDHTIFIEVRQKEAVVQVVRVPLTVTETPRRG